ncbi:MAG: HAD hydrolase family protein [Elusimicrobiota bacterium]|nr:HAD hydrolase family protein [Elusimicrobiota bacterium]
MEQKYSPEVIQRAKKIKVVLTDVDGVLTDASMNFFTTPAGATLEVKKFNAYDGIAFHMLRDSGIKTGIITGGNAPSTEYRAKALGMDYLYYNFLSKLQPLEDILIKAGVREDQVAFIGDDLIDLPVMMRVGLACCPGAARDEIKKYAHLMLHTPAGQGCYREVAELILKAQGSWDEVIAKANVGEIGLSRKKETLVVNFKDWKM